MATKSKTDRLSMLSQVDLGQAAVSDNRSNNTLDKTKSKLKNLDYPAYWEIIYKERRKTDQALPLWSNFIRQAIAEKMKNEGFEL